MLTKCDFHNIDGTHTYSLNSDVAPLTDFDVTVPQRAETSRNKSQQHGIYPTNTLRGGMEIHVEGSLFGTDSTGYVTERLALITALFGVPTLTPTMTDRKLGYIQVGLSGQSEDWIADVTISAFSAPIKGLYPAVSPFLVTFFSWTPWFWGATTPANLYYWS